MNRSIDPLFTTQGKKPVLVERLEISRNYEGLTFSVPTNIFDVRAAANQCFHVQQCHVSVGGTVGESVEKTLRVVTGNEGERVLYQHTTTDNDVKISLDLDDITIADRLVIQLSASTPLNAYSTFYLRMFVYEL